MRRILSYGEELHQEMDKADVFKSIIRGDEKENRENEDEEDGDEDKDKDAA